MIVSFPMKSFAKRLLIQACVIISFMEIHDVERSLPSASIRRVISVSRRYTDRLFRLLIDRRGFGELAFNPLQM